MALALKTRHPSMRINRYLLFLFLFDLGQGGAILRPTNRPALLVPGFPLLLSGGLGWGFLLAGLISLAAFLLWAHWMETFIPTRIIRLTRIVGQGFSLMMVSAWLTVAVLETLFLRINLFSTFVLAAIVYIEAREIRWPDLTPGRERRMWTLLNSRGGTGNG